MRGSPASAIAMYSGGTTSDVRDVVKFHRLLPSRPRFAASSTYLRSNSKSAGTCAAAAAAADLFPAWSSARAMPTRAAVARSAPSSVPDALPSVRARFRRSTARDRRSCVDILGPGSDGLDATVPSQKVSAISSRA